jgi:hypothetical protein
MELAGDLFARQHGVAAVRQLRLLGITLRRQRTLERQQLWVPLASNLIVPRGSIDSWTRRAMAGTLSAPQAMLFGPSAARLHGLDGFTDHEGVEVIVADSAHVDPIDGVTYRYSRHLSTADRHTIERIPVTVLPVTLVQLHSRGHASGQALDSALRSGFSPRWMLEHFIRWQLPNLPAATALLQMLEERVDGRLPRSWFQRLGKMAFAAEGHVLVDEHPVFDAKGKHIADLDLADVELKVGVECQSWEHHGSPSAQQRDLRRKRSLRALGWEIVDVWWSDLERIDEVLADLRLALARARDSQRPGP